MQLRHCARYDVFVLGVSRLWGGIGGSLVTSTACLDCGRSSNYQAEHVLWVRSRTEPVV